MKLQVFLVVSCCALSAFADFSAIPFEECGEDFDNTYCTVDSVTVDACDVSGKYCELIRGESYRMDVRFTPQFDGSDLNLLAYAIFDGKPIPFAGMNSKACDFMECPIKKGVQQSYVFNVNVDGGKPRGKFNVRWLMKQGDENRCCFANKFQIF